MIHCSQLAGEAMVGESSSKLRKRWLSFYFFRPKKDDRINDGSPFAFISILIHIYLREIIDPRPKTLMKEIYN
jgi:hypothetical protein